MGVQVQDLLASKMYGRSYTMNGDQTKQLRKEARKQLEHVEDNWSSDMIKELRSAANRAQELYRQLGDSAGELEALRALVHVNFVEHGFVSARDMANERMEGFRRSGEKRGEALMRLALADICLRESQGREALREALEARDLFKQLGMTEKEILSLNRAASAHLTQCTASDALETAQEALTLAEDFGDMRGEATSLRIIAESRKMTGELKEALDTAKTSLAIFKQLTDLRRQVVGLLLVADIHLARDRPQEALQCAKEARSLAKKNSGKQIEAAAVGMMAQAMSKGNLPKEALKCAKEEQEMYQAIGDRFGEAASMRSMALARMARGEKRDALKIVKEAIQMGENNEDRKAQARLNLLAAEMELDTGKAADATRYVEEALAMFREEGFWRGEAEAIGVLLKVQLREGSSELLSTADDWRALFFDAGDRRGEATALCESARMLAQLELQQQAETMAAEAQAICQEIEDQRGEAEALLAMADVHIASEDSNRAVQSAQESLELWKLQGDEKGEVKALQRLARAQALEHADTAEAVRSAEQALSLVKRSRKGWATVRDEVSALQLLAEIQIQHLLAKGSDEDDENKDEQKDEEREQRKEKGGVEFDYNQEELDQLFKKIIDNSNLAVTKADLTDDAALQAAAWQALAQNHMVGRSWEGALEAAQEGLKVATKVLDVRQQGYFQWILADVHMNMNLLNKADDEAKAALAIFKDIGDQQGETNVKKLLDEMYGSNRPGRSGPAADLQYSSTDPEASGTAAAASSSAAVAATGPTKEYIMENLQVLAANVVGDRLDQDMPLMDSGMDSLSSVEFRNQVRGLVPGVNLPASLVFDHPNLRAMTDFIYEKSQPQP